MMQEIINQLNANYYIFMQLCLALLLGMALGTERTVAHKNAGLRTYALVSMGCCLLIVLGHQMDLQSIGFTTHFEPNLIASTIITGIGFLGAGLIIFKDNKISGLTTAAGLWVSAAIGVAVGYEQFALAVIATLLTLFTFTILWFFEKKVKMLYAEEPLSDSPEQTD